ncbi:hypothetical protein EMIT019CA3_10895 [Bacillus pseudomycoides]
MHRSGQSHFLLRATVKQREKTNADHFLFCIVADYILENQNGFI